MLTQPVPPGTYAIVHDFLRASPFTAESRSITAGHSPGWVFVDDQQQPSIAVVGSKGMEGFWLFSDQAAEDLSPILHSFARGPGRQAMAGVGCDYLEVSVSGDDCTAALRNALSPWDTEVITCIILRSDHTCVPDAVADAPDVVPLLDALDLPATDGVDLLAKVELFWGTPERFVQAGGMGYCTVVDRRPTSVCMSAFIDDNVHCVDMETHETFWRLGHGTAAATSFLRACRELDAVMHWSCMETNVASSRLARRIGLVKVGSYNTFGFDYPPSDADSAPGRQ